MGHRDCLTPVAEFPDWPRPATICRYAKAGIVVICWEGCRLNVLFDVGAGSRLKNMSLTAPTTVIAGELDSPDRGTRQPVDRQADSCWLQDRLAANGSGGVLRLIAS
jgi:hypothetical protein